MDRKPFPFRSEILASQRLRNHFLIIIIFLMTTRLCRPVAPGSEICLENESAASDLMTTPFHPSGVV